MSPAPHITRLHLRANAESTPTSKVQIQQATLSPVPGTPITFTWNTPTIAFPSPTKTPGPQSSGLSSETKIAIGMIPVVFVIVGLYILFLFWYRKRIWSIMPYFPGDAPIPFGHARCESGKVLNMSAFSTPIHGVENIQHKQMGITTEIGKSEMVESNTKAASVKSVRTLKSFIESLIDAKSPFRLKRGDTVKESNHIRDVIPQFPSPPPGVWLKPPNVHLELPRRTSSTRFTPRKQPPRYMKRNSMPPLPPQRTSSKKFRSPSKTSPRNKFDGCSLSPQGGGYGRRSWHARNSWNLLTEE